MQEKIKDITRNLLIAHGYHKTTFGVIAKALQITTTNIHYHFGNKNHLVEIVVREYVAEAKKNHSIIWLDTTTTLEQKVAQVVAYNYRLYRKYNPDDKGRHPWSLIGRLRLESDVLSDAACRSLASFTQTMQEVISQAVEYAWQQGQLKADTPWQDLVFLLTNLVDSSSVFAQDAGSFCSPGAILHRLLPGGDVGLYPRAARQRRQTSKMRAAPATRVVTQRACRTTRR